MGWVAKRYRDLQTAIVVGVLAAVAFAGCGEDSGAPNSQPADQLIGYWGITSVIEDGEITYCGPGDEGYWVIYENQTVCLIESLPSGEYEKDSTFVYERDQSRFIMRFDLDPIPASPDTMTFRLSAASDTLHFSAAANVNRPATELIFSRQNSIPNCGCDLIH